MLGTKIRVQHKVVSDYTDEQLLFLTQMGVKYVYVMFKDEHTDYDSVMRFMERLNKFGLVATDAGNTAIYKNAAMHLALPGRDEAIQRYNDFNRVLGKAGIRDMGTKPGAYHAFWRRGTYKGRNRKNCGY